MAKQKKEEENLPPFDSESGPGSSMNRNAARARRLRWDSRKSFYVDSDGCLVRDRFGQPL